MIRTLYVSAAARGITHPDIANILAVSRNNNWDAGVTGMLLHIDGGFLQVLEGPEQAVETTLARIKRDARHSQVITLWREAIEQRGFPDWSMGFDRLGNDDPRWDGAFRIDPKAPAAALAPDAGSEVLSFMQSFYDAAAAKRFA